MLDSIPDALKSRDQWVCWGSNKMPLNPHNLLNAKSNDSSTWGSFDLALSCVDSNKVLGVGYMFSESDPFVGIDIDHCLVEGRFTDPAVRSFFLLLWKSGTYCEVSMSGSGLHVIVENALPVSFLGSNKSGRNLKFCEVYTSLHYLALTGSRFYPRQKSSRVKTIENRLWLKILSILDSRRFEDFIELAESRNIQFQSVSEESKLQWLLARNAKFSFAYSGSSSGFKSSSERDFYVLSQLFKLYGDPALVEDFFLRGGCADLSRKKGHESDYLKRSINAVRSEWESQGSFVYQNFSQGGGKISQSPDNPQVLSPPPSLFDGNSYGCTDLENGRILLSKCRNLVRFCYETGQFYRWKFISKLPIWEVVGGYHLFDFCAEVSDLLHESATRVSNSEVSKRLFAGSKMMKMNTSSERAIDRLKSFPEIMIREDDFDSHRYLVPCRNGYLNLENGEFSDPLPSFFVTTLLDVDYVPGARSELFESFISQIMPDPEIRVELQKFLGLCLTGDVSFEKFAFFFGSGGNGKGTLLSAVSSVLSGYSGSLPVSTFALQQFDNSESPSPVLASLRSSRLVIVNEVTSSFKFQISTLKAFTGGDRLVARRLRQDPFSFVPRFKLILVGNEKVSFSSFRDKGIARRLLFFPFSVEIRDIDLSLKSRLCSQSERSGILNWLLDGWNLLRSEGFSEVASMVEGREELQSLDDLVWMFVEEKCVFSESGRIRRSSFEQYCLSWIRDVLHRTDFQGRDISRSLLSDSRITLIRPNNVQTYAGLAWKEGAL